MSAEISDVPQVRPWVRLWARSIDGILVSVVVTNLWIWISPYTFIWWNYNYGQYISITLIIWAFIEAVLLSTWGTTPGKWLLRIQVKDNNGSKLSFVKALYRSLSVWAVGEGCGFVFASLITYMIGYVRLTGKGKTYWDDKGEFTVSHGKIGHLRSAIAAVILIGITSYNVIQSYILLRQQLP